MTDTATTPARKEAAGIIKRSSAYTADPRTIARKPGFNARYDMGEIEELAASIKANGLLLPLRIMRLDKPSILVVGEDGVYALQSDPKGQYLFVLIDGDRRLMAIELLLKKGHEFPEGIPVILADKGQSELTSLIQMFVTNTGKPFLPLEEASAYKRMQDGGMTVKQICEAVGRKQVHVTEILALVQADESVKEAVKSGAIGKTMAKQIATHAKGDKAKQAELVEAAKAAGQDKGKKNAVRVAIDDSRRAKAAKKGKILKMRALSDAELSIIGSKLAESMADRMREAGKPLDFDLTSWVKSDDNLALAATFGALQALKAAAGIKIDLEF